MRGLRLLLVASVWTGVLWGDPLYRPLQVDLGRIYEHLEKIATAQAASDRKARWKHEDELLAAHRRHEDAKTRFDRATKQKLKELLRVNDRPAIRRYEDERAREWLKIQWAFEDQIRSEERAMEDWTERMKRERHKEAMAAWDAEEAEGSIK